MGLIYMAIVPGMVAFMMMVSWVVKMTIINPRQARHFYELGTTQPPLFAVS